MKIPQPQPTDNGDAIKTSKQTKINLECKIVLQTAKNNKNNKNNSFHTRRNLCENILATMSSFWWMVGWLLVAQPNQKLTYCSKCNGTVALPPTAVGNAKAMMLCSSKCYTCGFVVVVCSFFFWCCCCNSSCNFNQRESSISCTKNGIREL